jgi:predicted MFS family arabinose efflux permease
MIGDLVPRERLGLAMSIYGIGATLGVGLAMALGGVIVQWAMTAAPMELPLFGEITGWRAAFVLAGATGIPLAILFWLTVPEPARKASGSTQDASFRQLLAHMRKHAWAFTATLLSYSFAAITIYAFVVWAPSYFFRVHGLKPVQVGLGLAVILGLGSSIGAIVGGFVSDALQRRGRNDAPALVILVTQLVHVPFLVMGYLASDAGTAMVLLGMGMLIIGAFGGCQHVTFQTMTPTRLRGQIGAVYLLATSMIGLSLGPFIIGLLNGILGGPEKIGLSLALLAVVVGPIAAGLLALGLKSIRTAVAETTAGTA